MAAETEMLKFKIGDDEYDMPMLDDLDMDEWQILYDYTQLILDDFAPLEDEDAEQDRQRRTSQPGFTRAMLHIGYRRAHPDAKEDTIKGITGQAKLIHVLEALGESAAEEDETPLASTTGPAPSSPRSSVASNANASASSAKSSDAPGAQPEPIGTVA